MLVHAQELIGQLDSLGIKASPIDEGEEGHGDWEDESDEEDVDMT
jgi:hypothetical protein